MPMLTLTAACSYNQFGIVEKTAATTMGYTLQEIRLQQQGVSVCALQTSLPAQSSNSS